LTLEDGTDGLSLNVGVTYKSALCNIAENEDFKTENSLPYM